MADSKTFGQYLEWQPTDLRTLTQNIWLNFCAYIGFALWLISLQNKGCFNPPIYWMEEATESSQNFENFHRKATQVKLIKLNEFNGLFYSVDWNLRAIVFHQCLLAHYFCSEAKTDVTLLPGLKQLTCIHLGLSWYTL